MEADPKLSREQYIQSMRAKMEEILGRVADAVNEAQPGYVISGSEEQVRDLFGELQRQAYEQALQMRTNAAEAAFPPSEGPGNGSEKAQ
jgi:hypothetical protein